MVWYVLYDLCVIVIRNRFGNDQRKYPSSIGLYRQTCFWSQGPWYVVQQCMDDS